MTDQPPPGCEWRWKPARDWDVLAWPLRGRCRWTDHGVRCAQLAVADLLRRRSPSSRGQRWQYCADHLFGRIIIDGQVYERYAHQVDVLWHVHDLRAEFPVSGCGHHAHGQEPRHYHYVSGDRIDWRDEHGVDHSITRPA